MLSIGVVDTLVAAIEALPNSSDVHEEAIAALANCTWWETEEQESFVLDFVKKFKGFQIVLFAN